MAKKYAVWLKGAHDETKQYVYANTHRDAAKKYAAKNNVATTDCDTQKV